MTRHGPTWPRAEAIALRPTAPAVLEVGNTDLAADFEAISREGSDYAELEIVKPMQSKPSYVAAMSMLSGDLTAKSP